MCLEMPEQKVRDASIVVAPKRQVPQEEPNAKIYRLCMSYSEVVNMSNVNLY